jgi:NADH:ubiquinone oxidoreductase subunit E
MPTDIKANETKADFKEIINFHPAEKPTIMPIIKEHRKNYKYLPILFMDIATQDSTFHLETTSCIKAYGITPNLKFKRKRYSSTTPSISDEIIKEYGGCIHG